MTEILGWAGPDSPPVATVRRLTGNLPLPRPSNVLSLPVGGQFPNPVEYLRHLPRYCAPHLELIVTGSAAPQGSKVPGGRTNEGRITMRESSKKVAPWRADVERAVLLIISPDGGRTLYDGFPLRGPLVAEMTFTMPKPKSAVKKTRRTYPATHGNDSSKLVRSTEDALVKIKAIEDDGMIIEYLKVAKVFPSEDVDALAVPGALIRFWCVDRLPELSNL